MRKNSKKEKTKTIANSNNNQGRKHAIDMSAVGLWADDTRSALEIQRELRLKLMFGKDYKKYVSRL